MVLHPEKFRNSDLSIIPGYFITTLVIFMQGSIVMMGSRTLLLIFLFISGIIFYYKKLKIDSVLIIFFFFLLLITFIQYFQFNFISYNTAFGTLVRFLLPYFLIKIIGKNYLKYYINILYFFAIISLLFYLPSILFPNFLKILLDISSSTGIQKLEVENNLIIYSARVVTRLGVLRNSGLFWEPGAYSGFLIIALLFNIVQSEKLWNWGNFIFIITIVSTFSTAGYIALFLTIFFYFATSLKRRGVYYLLIPLFCFGAWFAYFNTDFLGSRINSELTETDKNELEYTGRIGSGKKDLKDIVKYPFFGRGRNVATRFDNFNEKDILEFHRTNGVTDFVVKYGLLFSLFYLFNIYKSFNSFCYNYRFNKRFALLMLIVVLTIGFSQTFFQGIFFISLIYLHVLFIEPAKTNINNNFQVNRVNSKRYLQRGSRTSYNSLPAVSSKFPRKI